VDRQHRQLFQLIAKLGRLVDVQASSGEIQAALAQFVRWAEIHFASEAMLLEATGYAGVEAHVKEHAAFLKTLGRNVELSGSRPLAISEAKISALLTNWLQNHILEEDRAYVTHVVASLPAQIARAVDPTDVQP
jgi:hemerythrin